jgi:serine/threonine-protein kinase HipA
VGNGASQYAYEKLKLAMALRGRNVHYRLRDIQRRHWNDTARRCGLGPHMEDILERVSARAPAAIEDVGTRLPAQFPEGLFAVITQGLLRSVAALQREPSTFGA